MSTVKRKNADLGLQRRVRPRVEPEPESDIGDSGSEAPSEKGVEYSGSDDDQDNSGSEVEGAEEDEDADSEDGNPAGLDPSQLSFGALARAQASLPLARKKGKKAASDDEESSDGEHRKDEPLSFKEKKEKLAKRTSKHAPVELTSKKRVSRRRDFVDVPKREARDPRFMPLGGPGAAAAKVEEIKARKAYSFLDDYQKDELNQLKAAVKKEKDPFAKEKLEKAVMSMESRMKAQKRKDKERELLEEHRKKEKELVKQGKTPFYLKKSEQKKKLLEDQFAGMKKGQVDKAIARRRKKVAGKEKKLLPRERRTAEDR